MNWIKDNRGTPAIGAVTAALFGVVAGLFLRPDNPDGAARRGPRLELAVTHAVAGPKVTDKAVDGFSLIVDPVKPPAPPRVKRAKAIRVRPPTVQADDEQAGPAVDGSEQASSDPSTDLAQDRDASAIGAPLNPDGEASVRRGPPEPLSEPEP